MAASIFSINSNISSLKAQGRLAAAGDMTARSFARLSSGLRINSASDDAAGLAVSNSLSMDTRVFTQGSRNLNDGISLLHITDSTLEQLSSVVTRISELAEQAASGTLSAKQRGSLDAEAQALSKEYLRIVKGTSFNGIEILDGSLGTLRLQAGYGASGSVASGIGGKMGTGTFTAGVSRVVAGSEVQLGDVNNDGFLDAVTTDYSKSYVSLGFGNGSFAASVSYGSGYAGSTLGDVDNDGNLDIVGCQVLLGNGDGSFRNTSYRSSQGVAAIGDLNGDGIQDLIASDTGTGIFTALGNGDGSFRASRSYTAVNTMTYQPIVADLNNDNCLDVIATGDEDGSDATVAIMLGNGDGSLRAVVSYVAQGDHSTGVAAGDMNNDGNVDLVSVGDGACYLSVFLGKGDGTFREAITYDGMAERVLLGDVNGDGILDAVTRQSCYLGKGDGTLGSVKALPGSLASYALGDLTGDGVLDIVNNAGNLHFGAAVTRDGVSALLPFSLKNQADARQAIPVLKRTLESLAVQRGTIGALESRVHSALNTLEITRQNYTAANSAVRDADIADESANLIRGQILQRAASSVLAQANQTPALALQLL